MTNLIVTGCDSWIFLCEHDTIPVENFNEMKPIRMPSTSSNCNDGGTIATCKATLVAKAGQKISVSTGIYFAVGPKTSPCNSLRHVMFESKGGSLSKSDKKCGPIVGETPLFRSVGEKINVTYVSNNMDDGAVLHVKGSFYLLFIGR